MTEPMTDSVDRDWSLHELLPLGERERLQRMLDRAFSGGFRLCAAGGQAVLQAGDWQADWPVVALGTELEPLGYLQADAPTGELDAVGGLLDLLLQTARRYRTAADLHHAAMQEDYQTLQAKHSALQASEERYRSLAEELDQRVRDQVHTIEQHQRRLYQTEKLAAIGQLAAGVAHEINNPIGFVRSNLASAARYIAALQSAQAAGPQCASDELAAVLPDFSELVRESRDGVDRVATIVGDLREFSRVDRGRDEVVDVNQLVKAVCTMIRAQVDGQIALLQELAPVPPLRCEPAHLSQALYNLVFNAVQAVGSNGHILVGTVATEGEIRITVGDDGCGIEPYVIPRIFEPFFTTREVGEGVGLGLTVCNDVVQALGGNVEVQSMPGKGSTFTLHLPAAAG
ncbi:MAG: ATP-binding protein [Gammaproteobacteria bacterium]